MPWKLFFFVLCIVLLTCFVGFNLENRCTVSFGFTQFQDIPIFISLAIAFAAGIVLTIPFMITHKKTDSSKTAKKRNKEQKKSELLTNDDNTTALS